MRFRIASPCFGSPSGSSLCCGGFAMRVTDIVAKEAAKFHVALESAPEFSARVGILISCFALVEEYVPHLVVKLTGMPHADAWTILNTANTLRNRYAHAQYSLAERDDVTKMRIVVVREFPSAIKKKPREHRM